MQDESTPGEHPPTSEMARSFIDNSGDRKGKILKINVGQASEASIGLRQLDLQSNSTQEHDSGKQAVEQQLQQFFLKANSLESETEESARGSLLQRKYQQMMGLKAESNASLPLMKTVFK